MSHLSSINRAYPGIDTLEVCYIVTQRLAACSALTKEAGKLKVFIPHKYAISSSCPCEMILEAMRAHEVG